MSETRYNKESLIRLIMVGLDSVSSDKESAKSYLSEHGLDAYLLLENRDVVNHQFLEHVVLISK